MKIFLKKSRPNYKEKKMLEALEPIVKKQIEKDPDFARKFVPAKNFEELKSMYDRYVPQDVEFEEVKTKTINEMSKSKMNKVDDYYFGEEVGNDDSDLIDPFNRESPKVREYVLSEDPLEENNDTHKSHNPFQKFDEPTSFDEAFEIPESVKLGENRKVKQDDDEDDDEDGGGRSAKSSSRKPLNPDFNEMSTAKKKRQTQKFAKYLVDATCMLLEKGLVWYATKDISEAKLTEYEMNNEIDLSILLTLDDGQQATVRQFFESQCNAAEQLLKVSAEEKEDITELLAEVMMEKGIAPTVSQQLMLAVGTAVAKQVIFMFGLRATTNSVLAQLKSLKASAPQTQAAYYSAPTETPTTPKEEIESDQIREEIEKEMAQEEEVVSEYFSQTPNELAISQSIETVE